MREGIFTIGVGILLLGALAYAFMSKAGSFSGVLAIALIFSAGFSNLLDRISYGGSVVDFINIGIGPLRSGIFNIADIASSHPEIGQFGRDQGMRKILSQAYG